MYLKDSLVGPVELERFLIENGLRGSLGREAIDRALREIGSGIDADIEC